MCMTIGDGAVTTDGTIPIGPMVLIGDTLITDGAGTAHGDTTVGDGQAITDGDIHTIAGDMPDIMVGADITTMVGGPIITTGIMAETMPITIAGAEEGTPIV